MSNNIRKSGNFYLQSVKEGEPLDKSNIVLIVLDPLNEEVNRLKMPLHPESINLLAQSFKASGNSFSDIVMVNCCGLIPKDQQGSETQKLNYGKTQQEELHSIIKRLNPKLIITMGSLALKLTAMSNDKITKTRGKFREISVMGKHFVMFPTYSPSMIFHSLSNVGVFNADIDRISKYINNGFSESDKLDGVVDYSYCTDLSELLDLSPKRIVIDTETTGLDVRLPDVFPFLCQITYKEDHSLLVPIQDGWRMKELPRDQDKLSRHLRELLSNPKVSKIGHNLKFDTRMLQKVDFPVKGVLHDTMLLCRALDENMLDKSLNTCVATFVPKFAGFNDEIEKTLDKSKMIECDLETLRVYAGNDTNATFKLFNVVHERVKQDSGQYGWYKKVAIPAMSVISNHLETNGLTIDEEELRRVSIILSKEVKDLSNEILGMCSEYFISHYITTSGGKAPNLASIPFKTAMLFSKEGFNLSPLEFTDATKNSKKPVPSTNSKHLNKIKDQHPIIDKLLEYSVLNKLSTTYVGSPKTNLKPAKGLFQHIVKGRINPSYHLHTTVTGRLSSSNPNGQNLPKRGKQAKTLRRAFVAPEGYSYVECVKKGTLVTTDRGLRRVETLEVGDNVLTHLNRFKPVTKRMSSNKIGYTIELDDGNTIECSTNHPFLTIRKGKLCWVEAKHLSKTDHLLYTHRDPYASTMSSDEFWFGYHSVKDGGYNSVEIPENALTLSEEAMCGVVAKLFNVCGSYHASSFCYVSNSREDRDIVATMCRHLGYFGVSPEASVHDQFSYVICDQDILKCLPIPSQYNKNNPYKALWDTAERECITALIPSEEISMCKKQLASHYCDPVAKIWSPIPSYKPLVTRTRLKEAIHAVPQLYALKQLLNYRHIQIKSITLMKEEQEYLDITVEDDKSFHANSIIVHNCDFSQMELRIMAWIANVKGMLKAYSEGQDLHEVTACGNIINTDPIAKKIFREQGIDGVVDWFHELKKLDDGDPYKAFYNKKRQDAKGLNFGNIYLVQPRGLLEFCKTTYGRVDMTLDDAETEQEAYYKQYPELLTYFDYCRRFILKHGYIRNVLGLKRNLPDAFSATNYKVAEAVRQGVNATDQGVGAILATLGLIAVGDWIDSLAEMICSIYLCGMIHDSLVLIIKDTELDNHIPIIVNLLENPPVKKLFNVDMPVELPVDVQVGKNLAEMKDYTLPKYRVSKA